MKLFKSLAVLALPLAMLFSGVSNANVITFPALEVNITSGDAGLSLTATTLTIDATITGILDEFNNFTDIADQTFTLTSTGTHSSSTPPGAPGPIVNGTFDGTFIVGGGLLSGTFTGMSFSGLATQPTLNGAINYTGGSLQGGLSGGVLNLSTAGSHVIGKLGAVVPVPAAAWLFGSGLLGLVGIARRKIS